jgi:hypothetical protein
MRITLTYVRIMLRALGIWDVMTVFLGLIFGSTSEAQISFVCPFKSSVLHVVHSDYSGCDSVKNWPAFVLWHFQFLSLCFSFWGINNDTWCQTANPVVGKQWNSWDTLLLWHEFRHFGMFHKWPPRDITSWIHIFCLDMRLSGHADDFLMGSDAMYLDQVPAFFWVICCQIVDTCLPNCTVSHCTL